MNDTDYSDINKPPETDSKNGQQQSMYIVGFAGASGSGKTLLCKTLLEELGKELGENSIGIIKEDSYYRDLAHMPVEERAEQNYDHPDAFEHELFYAHLADLRAGKAVDIPTYSYVTHTRTDEVQHFTPPKILILEGILMLHDIQLREMMNLKVFVSTPLDVSFIRRLKRDVSERGRSLDNVVSQYFKTARPMYYQYIRPSMEHADLIVPHGGRNRQAIDLLKARIREQMPL